MIIKNCKKCSIILNFLQYIWLHFRSPYTESNMETVNKMLKSMKKVSAAEAQLYGAYGIFGATALYAFYAGQITTIGLAIGIALIMFVIQNNIVISLISGSLAALVAVHCSRRAEGFRGGGGEAVGGRTAGEANDPDVFEDGPKTHAKTSDDDEEAFEGDAPAPAKKRKVPDNGKRAEFFKLGKKYTGPSEDDDAEVHLDAGTTFLNAYKSLKPDQVAAMTKDTQELMQTQKQLMSTLATLKPLIQDGKQMMDMFQGYFGGGANSMT
jgi:hypothetical protein